MAIRKSPYATTACSGFILDKTINAIKEYQINVRPDIDPKTNLLVVDRNLGNSIVPSFFHPIPMPPTHDDTVIAVDVRPAVKYDPMTHVLNVKNQYEHTFITTYGKLVNFWINRNHKELASISNNPISLYARWISENLAKRFGLDPAVQLKVAVLAAFFYMGLFLNDTNDIKPDVRDLQRICPIIGRTLYVSADDILGIIGDLRWIINIHDFCDAVREVTQSIQLESLNPGLLISILKNTWYGTNAAELTAVAIEYPPTWILLTYAAYTDRSYKNTVIAKLASRDKKPGIESFVKSLDMILS